MARLRDPRTPSPDVRCAHPGLRSLEADCASASMPALVSYAGSRGTGIPEPPAANDTCTNRLLEEGSGLPMPSSGLWERAQPGWRSEADMQRAEASEGRGERPSEGVGSPGPVGRDDTQCEPMRETKRKKPAALSRRGLEMWRRADFSAPSVAEGPGSPYRTASCSIFALGTECRWSMPFSRVSITVATGPTSRTVPCRPATLTVSPVCSRCRT